MYHVLNDDEAASKFPEYDIATDVVVEFYGDRQAVSDSDMTSEIQRVKEGFAKHYDIVDLDDSTDSSDHLSWIWFSLKYVG